MILEDGDIFLVTPEDHTILSGEDKVNRSIHKVDETEKPVEL